MKCDICGKTVQMFYVNYGTRYCLSCVKRYQVKRVNGPWFVRKGS